MTATAFSGSGASLTGIVTSLTAGNNVTITESSGDYTIDVDVFDPTAVVNFTDETDNILGNPDSGTVQVDGIWCRKNTTIGGSLRVQGRSLYWYRNISW